MTNDPVSTEQVWELLSEKLRGFLLRRVSDPQVAEDLLQETFLRIHRKLDGGDGLEGQGRLSAWVFQVARNLVVDHYRSGAGPAELPGDEAAARVEDEANINPQVAGWLPAMIAQLPEAYREPVALYELERIPQQEIADRLGLTLSGTKSRIQRGRAKLKVVLLDCCSFEQDRRGNIIDYRKNAGGDCGAVCDPTGFGFAE